jgi:hypothetical protein
MKNTASPLQRTKDYASYGNNHCLVIIINSFTLVLEYEVS